MPKARNEVKMKLFVWQGIFTDYTSGIAFAIAPNVEDARRQLMVGNETSDYHKAELASTPSIYPVTRRVCFTVMGDG